MAGLAAAKELAAINTCMARDDEYTLAEHFNLLAMRLRAKAAGEQADVRKLEWQRLADCYSDLARQQSPVDFFQR